MKIGFIGLGIMGKPMAKNILKAGYELVVTTHKQAVIDEMVAALPEQTAFILPERPRVAAECHIARTVCRRAERSCIALLSESRVEPGVKYLNRLSDYLFVYARYLAMVNGITDDFWYQ